MALDPFAQLVPEMVSRVEAAHQASWDAIPELAASWGERGRFHARQDMAFHAIFLEAARKTHPSAFVHYVQWVAGILDSRGVPVSVLRIALRELARTGPDGVEILEQAIESLQNLPALPPVNRDCPIARALLSGQAGQTLQQLGPCATTQQHAAATAELMKAMVTVGEMWAQGQISVAEEHLATATCQRVLATLREQAPVSTGRGTLLLACAEGNLHDLGLRATADQCAAEGWDAIMLGADVPTDDLVQMARSCQPDAVFVSTALATQVYTTKQTVERLHAAGVGPVFVGGHAFATSGDTWKLTGADGCGMRAVELLPR